MVSGVGKMTHRTQLTTHRHALKVAKVLASNPAEPYSAGDIARALSLPLPQDAIEAARLLETAGLVERTDTGAVPCWVWAL